MKASRGGVTWKRAAVVALVLALVLCLTSSYRIARRDDRRERACATALEELRTVVPERTAEAGPAALEYYLVGARADEIATTEVAGMVDLERHAWVLEFTRDGEALVSVAYVGESSYVLARGEWSEGELGFTQERSPDDIDVQGALGVLTPGSLSDPREMVEDLALSVELDQTCSRLADDSAHVYSRPYASDRTEQLYLLEVDGRGRLWTAFVSPSSKSPIYSTVQVEFTYGAAELPRDLVQVAGL